MWQTGQQHFVCVKFYLLKYQKVVEKLKQQCTQIYRQTENMAAFVFIYLHYLLPLEVNDEVCGADIAHAECDNANSNTAWWSPVRVTPGGLWAVNIVEQSCGWMLCTFHWPRKWVHSLVISDGAMSHDCRHYKLSPVSDVLWAVSSHRETLNSTILRCKSGFSGTGNHLKSCMFHFQLEL